jgi:sialate O-acetylesterase
MVIQANEPFVISGKDVPFGKIQVIILNKTESTIADDTGNWIIGFDALSLTDTFNIQVKAGSEERIIHHVKAGEVWLCGGQSNMERSSAQSDVVSKVEDFPQDGIRCFLAQNDPSDIELEHVKGEWVIINKDNFGKYSAVGISFGRFLSRSLNKTIGLVVNARGGTPVESWTKLTVLEQKLYNQRMFRQRKQWAADRGIFERKYEDDLKQWRQAVNQAKAAGQEPPSKPWPPFPLRKNWEPGSLYNALVCPLRNFSFKGVLWYQGESNANDPGIYEYQLTDMISCWRRLFNKPGLPFYIIQLPEYKTEENWVLLRESQAKVAIQSHNALIVTLGLGDSLNIHPLRKTEVGRRASLLVLNRSYHVKNVPSGPVLKKSTRRRSRIILLFNCFGSSLHSSDGLPVRNFEIAGKDGHLQQANVRIKGKRKLVIWCDIQKPWMVQYAWKNVPSALNLVNKENLPAAPFKIILK